MDVFNKNLIIGTLLVFSSVTSASQTDLKFTKPTGVPSPVEHKYTLNVGTHADKIFNDLKKLETDVESQLRTEMGKISKLKSISYVDVNTDNLKAVFTGENTSRVSLSLAGLQIKAQAKFKGVQVFCSTVRATINLKNTKAKANYNYYSGQLTNLDFTYDKDVDLSCSGGILSFPGVSQLVSLFANNYAEAKIDDMIKSSLKIRTEIINMKKLFGLSELMNKPQFSHSVTDIEEEFDFDLTNALNNVFTGLNVSVGIYRNKNGSNKHQIHMGIYQGYPKITNNGPVYSVNAPGASRFKKYVSTSNGMTAGSWSPGLLYNGQTIGSIAFNSNYGLYSYMTQKIVTIGDCGKPCE
ncbi:MAG: hypothetical protein ACI9LM_000277 [Alteromonadaceae bacterium]|jgi:hypothetical protein